MDTTNIKKEIEFLINTREFEKILSKVINVVPPHNINTIYENIKLSIENKVLYLSATDTQIYFDAKTQIDFDGKITIILPPKLVYETIKSVDDEVVKIGIDEEKFKVKIYTNTGVFAFSLLSSELYPNRFEVEKTTDLKFNGLKLKEYFDSTLFAVNRDETRLAMSGVLVDIRPDHIRFVSTDGHRLVKYSILDVQNSFESKIIIPSRAVNILTKILVDEEIMFSFNESFLKVETSADIFVVRLIDDNYPNYDSVIPLENENILEVDRQLFLKTLKRVSIYTNLKQKQVRLLLQSDIMKLKAEDNDLGSDGLEQVLCEYKGAEMEIAFNPTFLNDILSNIHTDRVRIKIGTPVRACIIEPIVQKEGTSLIMLVMPMRING